jgi:hypothetical protein
MMMLNHTGSKYAGKRALSIEETLEIVPFGRTLIYEALKNKRLVARKLGRRTLILVEDLERFLNDLPVAGGNHSA